MQGSHLLLSEMFGDDGGNSPCGPVGFSCLCFVIYFESLFVSSFGEAGELCI